MDLLRGDRPLLLVAVLAVGGLALLSLYALSLGPDAVAIGDLDAGRVGSRVEVVGLVGEVRTTTAGLVLVLYDPLDLAQVRVFVPSRVAEDLADRESLVPGAEVRVRGEVQLYGGSLEIVVAFGGDVVVLRGPTSP